MTGEAELGLAIDNHWHFSKVYSLYRSPQVHSRLRCDLLLYERSLCVGCLAVWSQFMTSSNYRIWWARRSLQGVDHDLSYLLYCMRARYGILLLLDNSTYWIHVQLRKVLMGHVGCKLPRNAFRIAHCWIFAYSYLLCCQFTRSTCMQLCMLACRHVLHYHPWPFPFASCLCSKNYAVVASLS